MQSHAHNQLKHHIQQPLFKLTTSSAPSPQTSSSYFASPIKSVSHGHQLNIRPVNSPSSNYFRPNTPRQKERGDQIQFFQYILRGTKFINLLLYFQKQRKWKRKERNLQKESKPCTHVYIKKQRKYGNGKRRQRQK